MKLSKWRNLLIKFATIAFLTASFLMAAPLVQKPTLAVDDNADQWTQLPAVTEGGNAVTVKYKQYAVAPDGTAYYVYLIGTKLYLRKLNGAAWTYPMSAHYFTLADVQTIHLFAIAPNGTPYLTATGKFGGTSTTEKLYKFNGTTWVCVMSNVWAAYDIRFSKDSRPYVSTNTSLTYLNTSGASTSITYKTGASDGGISDFAIAPDNTPYAVMTLIASDYSPHTKLRKYVNGAWAQIGGEIPCGQIQIAGNGTVYLAVPNPNEHSAQIFKVSGSSLAQVASISRYDCVSAAGFTYNTHYFYLGSDGAYYLLYNKGSDGFGLEKSCENGTLWLEGSGITPPADWNDTCQLYQTASGNFYLDYESNASYLYKFKFAPAIPTLSNLSLSIYMGQSNVSTFPLGKTLLIDCDLSTNDYSTVKAMIYDPSNQLVATISKSSQLTGPLEFIWDGKATADNTAGLQAGDYVSFSAEGLNYTIKVYASDSAGGVYSSPASLTIIGNAPKFAEHYGQQISPQITLSPVKQTIGSFLVVSDLPITVTTTIRNESNEIIALITSAESYNGVDNIGNIQWDGTATAGNEAGLNPGDPVPATEEGVSYNLSFKVSNAAGSEDSNGYTMVVKKLPPTIGVLSPTPSDGNFHLGTDTFFVSASATTSGPATVKLLVYNASDELVASVPYTVTMNVSRSYGWDGKTTAGNEAGLTAGDFVPASKAGVAYTVKLSIENIYGSQVSSDCPITVFCNPPTLSNVALNPMDMFHITSNSNYLAVTGTLTSAVQCSVSAKVKDGAGNTVADLTGTWQSGSNTICWYGRATAGNEAGLPANSIVPDGSYSIKAVITNCAGSIETDILPFNTVSSDVSLSDLSVSSGNVKYNITPVESGSLVICYVNVPYTVSSVCVVATPDDVNAGISYSTSLSLKYGTNTSNIVVTAQDGTKRTYQLNVTRAYPPKPTLSSLTVIPSAGYGFTPGGTNRLQVKTTLKSPVPALIELQIFNASGKLVAKIPLANQAAGAKTLSWSGRATAGNSAGIAAGKYVPVSSAGTAYMMKVFSSNPGGGVYSATVKLKLFSNPTVSGFSVSPTTFTPNTAGTKTVRIGFKVSHVSNVNIRILNTAGKVVAILSFQNMVPNKLKYFYWNGKATAGNTARYAAGALVPAGKYSVQIVAGNTVYKPSKKVLIKR